MKVLLTVASLSPSYGGPAFSVSGLATALAEVGTEVGLWAPDQSAGTTPLLSSRSLVRRIVGTEAEALDRFGKPDVLHDNGIWLPHNHRLAVLALKRGVRRIVSPRGMLEPWALRHKRLKKSLAWSLFQRRDLKRAGCHHATAEMEAHNVSRLGFGVPVTVIPNGVVMPEERSPASPGQKAPIKTALFMGRIYPVKGLPMLIQAWASVRPKGWILRIVGPDEAGHRKEIESAVSAAGLSDVVLFSGPLQGQEKTAAFSHADVFVLPTHSESFGVVISEALAHGVPVLTTTGAPWPEIPSRGCGWRVEPTVDAIAEGLRFATALDSDALRVMGAKGRMYVAEEFSWKRVATLMLAAYRGILTTPAN